MQVSGCSREVGGKATLAAAAASACGAGRRADMGCRWLCFPAVFTHLCHSGSQLAQQDVATWSGNPSAGQGSATPLLSCRCSSCTAGGSSLFPPVETPCRTLPSALPGGLCREPHSWAGSVPVQGREAGDGCEWHCGYSCAPWHACDTLTCMSQSPPGQGCSLGAWAPKGVMGNSTQCWQAHSSDWQKNKTSPKLLVLLGGNRRATRTQLA